MNYKDFETVNEILNDLSYTPAMIYKVEWIKEKFNDFRVDYDCLIDEQKMFVTFECKTANIDKDDVTPELFKLIVEIAFGQKTTTPGKSMDTLNIGADFISHVFSSINYLFNRMIKELKKNKELQKEFKNAGYDSIEIHYGKFTPKKDFDNDKRRQKIYDYVLQKIFKWKFELKFADSFYYKLNQPIKIK